MYKCRQQPLEASPSGVAGAEEGNVQCEVHFMVILKTRCSLCAWPKELAAKEEPM